MNQDNYDEGFAAGVNSRDDEVTELEAVRDSLREEAKNVASLVQALWEVV